MRLTLVRHAKSSWKNAGQNDHDRPLNKRGKRDAPRMARAFAAWQAAEPMPVDWSWISTATRAVATAEALCGRLALPSHLQLTDRRLYLASPTALLDVLKETPRDRQWPILVGHNPGITQLANLLAGRELHPDLPTLAMVTLEFAQEEWAELAFGTATLVKLWTPKGMADA